jgi:hypothetical protein
MMATSVNERNNNESHNNDWKILKRIMASNYCVDRLALSYIDRHLTNEKWNQWLAQSEHNLQLRGMRTSRYRSEASVQSLVAAAVPHGLSVIDALINLGGVYDDKLFRSIIVKCKIDVFHQLMERSDAQAVISTLGNTLRVDDLLVEMTTSR